MILQKNCGDLNCTLLLLQHFYTHTYFFLNIKLLKIFEFKF